MFGKPHAETPSPNMGEGREGEAALRYQTIFARFPHPNPPPNWGRGNDVPSSTCGFPSRGGEMLLREEAS
jgi:hypothetical protein